MKQGEWTAIILAGRRPGEDAFALGYGVTAKALIRVGGEAMLGRVAKTLLAVPAIGRIVVLAQEAEALFAGDLAWLGADSRVSTAIAGEGISLSIAAIAGSERAPYPLLIATADHPLLCPRMVEAFIAGAVGADAAFAVVDRATVEAIYPETRRTWLKFSDGGFTGANLFALTTPAAKDLLAFWAKAETDRKKALRILSVFGPMIFLRALTRTIAMDKAVAKVGVKAGLRLRAVRLPFAEAAIDVDKPADHALAERILARRQALRGN